MPMFVREGVAQLTQRSDVTFRLWSDLRWKTRAVEEITIGSALSVESRRSFQCADIGAALGPLRPNRPQASLVLPVTTLPKRPLLGFDVSAPDRTVAYLPPRAALAELEADFVTMLAEHGGVEVPPRLRAVLGKVCEFSPGKWTRWKPGQRDAERLRSYLETHTGWRLDAGEVEAWAEAVAPAAATLAGAIELPPDETSSAENPLLVLPLLRGALRLRPVDVLPLLRQYARFVESCTALTDLEPFAPHAVLAEYGRRWEVMIECTVPLDGPFMVRMSERRPLDLDWRGRADLEVMTADAWSNHTVVRVTDENVVIDVGELDAVTLQGSPLHEDEFEGIRATREEVALYGSGYRERSVRLRLRLTPVWQVLATHVVVSALTIGSVVLLAVTWGEFSATDLAVIVIPTTFAASLAVTRERTTLATHLLAPWRATVLLFTAALWILVGAFFLSDTEAAQDPCPAVSVTPPVFAVPQHLPPDHARRCDGQEHR